MGRLSHQPLKNFQHLPLSPNDKILGLLHMEEETKDTDRGNVWSRWRNSFFVVLVPKRRRQAQSPRESSRNSPTTSIPRTGRTHSSKAGLKAENPVSESGRLVFRQTRDGTFETNRDVIQARNSGSPGVEEETYAYIYDAGGSKFHVATLSLESTLLVTRDERQSPLDVAVVMEEDLLLAELVVQIVEVRCVPAGHCVFREGAGHGELVEHGLVATDEAVLLYIGAAVILGDDVAHVEDETVVVHVGVVTVLGRASEGGLHGTDEEFHAVGKLVGCSLSLR